MIVNDVSIPLRNFYVIFLLHINFEICLITTLPAFIKFDLIDGLICSHAHTHTYTLNLISNYNDKNFLHLSRIFGCIYIQI